MKNFLNFVQLVTIVHIKSAEIPRSAIESTETLMNEASLTDKIDDMTTEENEAPGVMRMIGDVVEKAESLPAI